MKKENAVKVEVDGEKIELSSAFIGGVTNDIAKDPIGLYSGNLNIDYLSHSLECTLRVIIKMANNDLNLTKIEAKRFIENCCENAYIKENGQDKEDMSDDLAEYLKLMDSNDNSDNNT